MTARSLINDLLACPLHVHSQPASGKKTWNCDAVAAHDVAAGKSGCTALIAQNRPIAHHRAQFGFGCVALPPVVPPLCCTPIRAEHKTHDTVTVTRDKGWLTLDCGWQQIASYAEGGVSNHAAAGFSVENRKSISEGGRHSLVPSDDFVDVDPTFMSDTDTGWPSGNPDKLVAIRPSGRQLDVSADITRRKCEIAYRCLHNYLKFFSSG